MSLTIEQKAYGQQKNREYIWEQAKRERWEFKKLQQVIENCDECKWTELDEDMTGIRYQDLCHLLNITAW